MAAALLGAACTSRGVAQDGVALPRATPTALAITSGGVQAIAARVVDGRFDPDRYDMQTGPTRMEITTQGGPYRFSIPPLVAERELPAESATEIEFTAPNPGEYTIIGATLLGVSIALTEEVPMLAAEMECPHLLALAGLSLLVSYAMVFASGFDPDRPRVPRGPFERPLTGTTLAYAVSLLVAAGVLAMVQSIGLEDPHYYVLQQTLVLGFPAAVGGAAGQLAV